MSGKMEEEDWKTSIIIIQGLTKELDEYASIDNTEIGEYCLDLTSMLQNVVYMESAYREAWIVEVVFQLDYYKKNTVIVNKEVIDPVRIIKTLDYLNNDF